MKKLVRGIIDFRRRALPSYREKFARLALGQSPDTLFIACSDSRVAANVFASTEPGDMFVVRNVGNIIPCCGDQGHSVADESEAAAIEFALMSLNVANIIVCGHSECGAMHALLEGREKVVAPHLRSWLRHAEGALGDLSVDGIGAITPVNRLSQLNVLQQMENLRSYPVVRERLAAKSVRIHGWWFELSTATVHAFREESGRFVPLDEDEATRLLEQLENAETLAPAAWLGPGK